MSIDKTSAKMAALWALSFLLTARAGAGLNAASLAGPSGSVPVIFNTDIGDEDFLVSVLLR